MASKCSCRTSRCAASADVRWRYLPDKSTADECEIAGSAAGSLVGAQTPRVGERRLIAHVPFLTTVGNYKYHLFLRGCRRNDLRCQSSREHTRFGQPDPGERGPV